MLKLLGFSKGTTPKNRSCNDEDIHKRRILRETEYLLNIFPELVWHQIAGYITDPKDFQNFTNSSQFFRNLLLHKRTLYIFQSVFKPINKTLPSYDTSEVKALILNCRLVCRSWNKSIKVLSEEIWNPDWNIKNTGSFKPTRKEDVGKIIKDFYTFSTAERILEFKQLFEKCFYDFINPFPGRGISVIFHSNQLTDEHAPRFYRKLAKFLDTFGLFIFHCEFMLHLNAEKTNEAYCKLEEFLGSLPNLRTLIIRNLNPNSSSPTLKRLNLNLRHLQNLKLAYVSSTVCNAIVRDNWQIKSLCIMKSSFDICTDLDLFGGFENLEQLVLRGCNWKEIQKLSMSNVLNDWPVKRFHLELDTNSFKWVDLFEVLSKAFTETLEELVLFLPMITNESDLRQILKGSQETRLVMPNLRKLNMEVKNECSFDFLLGINESLEWLRIKGGKWKTNKVTKETQEVERQRIVRIWGYPKLYRSNIWKLFPNLKAVELEGWRKDICEWLYRHNERKRKKNRLKCIK